MSVCLDNICDIVGLNHLNFTLLYSGIATRGRGYTGQYLTNGMTWNDEDDDPLSYVCDNRPNILATLKVSIDNDRGQPSDLLKETCEVYMFATDCFRFNRCPRRNIFGEFVTTSQHPYINSYCIAYIDSSGEVLYRDSNCCLTTQIHYAPFEKPWLNFGPLVRGFVGGSQTIRLEYDPPKPEDEPFACGLFNICALKLYSGSVFKNMSLDDELQYENF